MAFFFLGLGLGLVGLGLGLDLALGAGALWVEGLCFFPCPEGCGGFADGVVVLVDVLEVEVVEGVVVDVVPEVVVEDVVPEVVVEEVVVEDVVLGVVVEDVVLGVVVDVVLGVVVLEVVVEPHDAETGVPCGADAGSWIADSGVSGGTFSTVTVVWSPEGSIKVTTQVSAEAVGSITKPLTTSDANTAITSFRLLNTVVA